MSADNKLKFKQWAKKIRVADENAFSELFHASYPIFVKFARKYTGQLDAAHDVVQEVFIKLWEVKSNIDPQQSLKSYLYKMVRNRSLNYLRDDKNANIALDDVSPENLKTDHEIKTDIYNENKESAKMLALINELPTRQQEAIRLSRFEGLDHDEIAYVMQISPRTVNNHIVAALHSLKEAWQAQKDQQTKRYRL